ncbi:NADH dehydrogenase [ubiquinone] iron-sulfur protein 5-like [Varroa jacobsoni]|uniref:NADH dehydrogenase [ubiquinone] iron-sulfur protein 5 n=1 Tax=Varroa destructor TaxID=109461 RepID=A0A7M7KMK4_VARDE|nr:NADH dehydrogenase [ubiquinone] iron-sulfur protein 5-like [Varroa destructor]XP_022696028.1 NADH dehydrogenase [ubiquinone] iron-sulfur protein 5-like [Varroa jacobsoni]
MSVTPIFRTPFTDLSSATLNYETIKQCRPFYVQYAKCQEAWGGSQFPSRCRYEHMDLLECVHHIRQQQRTKAIQDQREKLFREGKIKNRYMEAPLPDIFSQTHLKDPW